VGEVSGGVVGVAFGPVGGVHGGDPAVGVQVEVSPAGGGVVDLNEVSVGTVAVVASTDQSGPLGVGADR
jgi:hypothetical protein